MHLLRWPFDSLGDPPLQYPAHHPMEDVMSYIRGHWTPPSGNYLHRIAPATAMVIGFGTHNQGCGGENGMVPPHQHFVTYSPCHLLARDSLAKHPWPMLHTILRGSSGTIWRGGKVSEQEFWRPHHNHSTSINAEIDRRDDGDVCIAQQISDILQAKIRWGLLIPWQRGVQI